MNKIYCLLISIFYIVAHTSFSNVASASMLQSNKSYFQLPFIPSQGIAPRQRVDAIMAKWQLRIVQYAHSPNRITGSQNEIGNDRKILEKARQDGVSQRDANQIGQILMVLFLAELRLLINTTKTAEALFPGSFTDYTTTLSQPNANEERLKIAGWYIKNTQRTYELMTKLKQFLTRNPKFYYDPPSLLVGIGETYRQGIQAFLQFKKFSGCFEHPKSQKCIALGSRKPRAQKQRAQQFSHSPLAMYPPQEEFMNPAQEEGEGSQEEADEEEDNMTDNDD